MRALLGILCSTSIILLICWPPVRSISPLQAPIAAFPAAVQQSSPAHIEQWIDSELTAEDACCVQTDHPAHGVLLQLADMLGWQRDTPKERGFDCQVFDHSIDYGPVNLRMSICSQGEVNCQKI